MKRKMMQFMLLTSILIEEFRPIKNESAVLVGRFVRMGGLEPPLREELDPKSNAATNYATSAKVLLA